MDFLILLALGGLAIWVVLGVLDSAEEAEAADEELNDELEEEAAAEEEAEALEDEANES